MSNVRLQNLMVQLLKAVLCFGKGIIVLAIGITFWDLYESSFVIYEYYCNELYGWRVVFD